LLIVFGVVIGLGVLWSLVAKMGSVGSPATSLSSATTSLYIPLATSLLISVVLSVILCLIGR
jgi:hypothetical protein